MLSLTTYNSKNFFKFSLKMALNKNHAMVSTKYVYIKKIKKVHRCFFSFVYHSDAAERQISKPFDIHPPSVSSL